MDFSGYLQFVVALLFVLGLIGLSGVLLRRLSPGARVRRAPGMARRLEVLEVLPIDARRRLVMVRRDGTAHLLLLGMNDDRVIETGFDVEAPPGHGGDHGGGRERRAPQAPGYGGAGPRGDGFRRLVDRFGGGAPGGRS